MLIILSVLVSKRYVLFILSLFKSFVKLHDDHEDIIVWIDSVLDLNARVWSLKKQILEYHYHLIHHNIADYHNKGVAALLLLDLILSNKVH